MFKIVDVGIHIQINFKVKFAVVYICFVTQFKKWKKKVFDSYQLFLLISAIREVFKMSLNLFNSPTW